ncbi:hypothetical protein KBD81_01620 [Candidatus Woesebacteria bacterium]|nr:hypothetical protein [Candidatus Woesebacteria bacterium]
MGEDLSTEKLTEAGSRNHSKLLIGLALVEFIGIVILLIVLYRIQIHYSGIESASQEYITTLKNVIDANDQNKTVPVDSQDESTLEEVFGFKVQIDPDEKGFFIFSKNESPPYYKRITVEDILGMSYEEIGNGAIVDYLGWGDTESRPNNRPKYWGSAYILVGNKKNFFSFDIKTKSLEIFDGTFTKQEFLLNKDIGKVAYSNAWQSFSKDDIATQDEMLYLRIQDLKTSKNEEVITVPSEGISNPFFAPEWISVTQLKYTNPQTGQEELYELKEK